MQVLHITFGPQALQSEALCPSVTANWGSQIATGICELLYTKDHLPALVALLDHSIYHLKYQKLSTYAKRFPNAAAAFGNAELMTNASTLADDPVKIIGQHLFERLFPSGSGMRELFDAFRAKQGDKADQDYRIALHFVRDKQPGESDIAPALLMLPWEALWPAGKDSPLVLDNLAVLRTCQMSGARLGAEPRQLDPVLTMEALSPNYGMDSKRHIPFQTDALPRPFYDGGPVWCDMLEPQHGLTADELDARLRDTHPNILHYFGHGDRVQEVFAWLLEPKQSGQTEGQIDNRALPYSSRRLLQQVRRNSSLQLFVSFACVSAQVKPGDFAGRIVKPENSPVTTLGEWLPALLAMQVTIRADSAALASKGLYPALAKGHPLPLAIGEAREALSNQEGLPVGRRAWWVPVLYVRDATSELVFATPKRLERWHLQPDTSTDRIVRRADRRRADHDPPLLLDKARAGMASHLVLRLCGPPGSGKTTLLRQLLGELEQQGHKHIGLRVEHDIASPQGQWRERLQREIVCALRRAQNRHVTWKHAHAEYEQALAEWADSQHPFVVLIDDIHLLRAEDQVLFTNLDPKKHPNVRFVVTYKTSSNDNRLARADELRIPDFTPEESQQVDQARQQVLFERHEKNFDPQRKEGSFAFIDEMLFGVRVPLSANELIDIADAAPAYNSLLAASPPLRSAIDSTLYQLREYVRQTPDQRYALRDPTMYLLWNDLHEKDIYPGVVKRIKQWRDSFKRHAAPEWRHTLPGVASYPEALLRIVADPYHRKVIEPFPEGSTGRVVDLSKSGHRLDILSHYEYQLWEAVANRYFQQRLTQEFQELAVHKGLPKSGQELDLDKVVIRYLKLLSRYKEAQFDQDNTYLWAVYQPHEREPVRRWLDATADTPQKSLLRVTLNVAAGIDQVGDLAARLKYYLQLGAEQRKASHFVLRHIVVPVLREHPPVLEALIDELRPIVGSEEKLALGWALAMSFRGEQHHFNDQARSWLEETLPAMPYEALPLLIALLPIIPEPERRRLFAVARGLLTDIVAKLEGDELLSTVERLAREAILVYYEETFGLEIHTNLVKAVLLALNDNTALRDQWKLFNEAPSTSQRLEALRVIAAYLRCCALLARAPTLPVTFEGTVLTNNLVQTLFLNDLGAALSFSPWLKDIRDTFHGTQPALLDLSNGSLLTALAEVPPHNIPTWHEAYLRAQHDHARQQLPMEASDEQADALDVRALAILNDKDRLGGIVQRYVDERNEALGIVLSEDQLETWKRQADGWAEATQQALQRWALGQVAVEEPDSTKA